jgi:hypothetical protein
MMVEKIVALLDGLTLEEIDKLPPARQRKLSDLCRYWHQIVERRLEKKPKSGVLADLRRGHRQE